MHQNQNQNQSQKSEEILDKLTDLQDKLDFQIAQFEQNRTKHEEHLRNVKQEVKEKEVLLKDLKTKIHLANNSVKEREQYLADQEETINKIINKGNEKLLDLNDQIGSSELRLGDLQSEIITNDKLLTDLKYNVDIEKISLEHDIDTLENIKNNLLIEISHLKDKLHLNKK